MSDWWSADPIAGDAPAAPQAPALAPAHRDLAIRTIYGEAGNEPDEGQAAVAAVIKNRMQAGRYGGDSVPGVVLAKNQFEPWGNNDARARMMALKQDDPRYQKIGGIVDQMFGGQMEDPTNGATHFVAPQAQAALGRSMPSWAQGEGQAIGRHTFFAPEGRVQAAGGNWWANDPVAGQQPQQPAPVGVNTEGLSNRVAREGMSPPAPPPPTLGERLAKAYETAPPNGLISTFVKPVVELMKAGHGDIPMTDASGHTNPEVIQRAWDAAKVLAPATAAPGGILAAPIGRGIEVAAQAAPKVTPTLQELKSAAVTNGYQGPEVAALEMKPSAISEWAQGMRSRLTDDGFGQSTAKGINAELAALEKPPEGSSFTGRNLEALRKTFNTMSQERQADGTLTPNAAAAIKARQSLFDEFPSNLKTGDVISGDLAAMQSKIKEANANYAAYKSAKSIDKTAIDAQNRAGAANSGMNVANTVRQRLATVMNNEGQFSRFTPEQQDMIREVVHGSPSANAVRFVGNLLGGGGGLGAIVSAGIGAVATGGPGAVAPAVGFALKSLSNRMTLAQTARLSEAIRSSAPLANAMNDFGAKAAEFSKAQSPRAIAAVNIAARNLSNNLRDAGITMSPGDLLRSLSGPMKSAADNEQPNP